MITEDHVSFETAKLLKEKGFDEPCYCFYEYKKRLYNDMDKYFPNGMKNSDHDKEGNKGVSAPTQAMAMKWLREVHKVHIIAEPCLGGGYDNILCFNRWFWTILVESGEYKPIRKIDEFPTYETACEDAIKHCLENLI